MTSVTVDASRNVRSITFEAAASAYTIGVAAGNPLLLSNGGKIQMTAAVVNDETVNAPLVLEGANARYTFSNDSANALNLGGRNHRRGGRQHDADPIRQRQRHQHDQRRHRQWSGDDGRAVVKSGAGAWVLSGNNTFTGGVTIDGGTLRVGSLARSTRHLLTP